MGSEGYLTNQFLVARTNQKNDEYGNDRFANRMRLALEIVRDTWQTCGRDYIIIFRLSLLDLVEGRSTWEEVRALAYAGGRMRDLPQHGHRLARGEDS